MSSNQRRQFFKKKLWKQFHLIRAYPFFKLLILAILGTSFTSKFVRISHPKIRQISLELFLVFFNFNDFAKVNF